MIEKDDVNAEIKDVPDAEQEKHGAEDQGEAAEAGGLDKESEAEPNEATVEERPALTAAQQLDLRRQWEKVRQAYARRLEADGKQPNSAKRYLKTTRLVVDWCVEQGLSPGDVTPELKTKFAEYVAALDAAPVTKNVGRLSGHAMMDEALTMGSQVEPDQQEEEYDGAPEGEEPDEGEEPEPPKRKAQQQQVVFVAAPAKQPRSKNPPGPAPRSTLGKLIRTEKVRIFKRSFGGKKIICGDYTTDEIGGSLHKFIKEFVDPEMREPNGLTTYEVFEVDPRNDSERGIGVRVDIQSTGDQQPDDDISRARGAVDLIRELRELDEEKRRGSTELLSEASKRAVSSGDTTQLMMLMMMQNMMAPKGTEDIAAKVLEHLRSGRAPEIMAPPPLPPIPMAPIAPPEDPMRPVMAEVLKQAVTPKPEKSTVDLVKELAVIREIFAPAKPEGDPEMKALLREVLTKVATPAPSTGIDGALATFDKLTNVVKTLAPQVNMGGITGALQSIITPQLGAALGNMLAEGINKTQAFRGQPAPAVPQQPAKPSPAQLSAQAVQRFRAAPDEPSQIASAVQMVGALYDDPQYKAQLEPALQALFTGNVEPAILVATDLLKTVRPELATRTFAGKVVAALIRSAGGTPPVELENPTVPTPVRAEPGAQEVQPAVQEQPKAVEPEPAAASTEADVTTTEAAEPAEVVKFPAGRPVPPEEAKQLLEAASKPPTAATPTTAPTA